MKSHQIHTSMLGGIERWARSFLSQRSLVACELSGDDFDSQFCEMKKVNAPDGVREVRVSSSSLPACSSFSCGSSASSSSSFLSEST